jgi:hypothetical protein
MVETSPFRPSKFYVAIPAIEPESSEYDAWNFWMPGFVRHDRRSLF